MQLLIYSIVLPFSYFIIHSNQHNFLIMIYFHSILTLVILFHLSIFKSYFHTPHYNQEAHEDIIVLKTVNFPNAQAKITLFTVPVHDNSVLSIYLELKNQTFNQSDAVWQITVALEVAESLLTYSILEQQTKCIILTSYFWQTSD